MPKTKIILTQRNNSNLMRILRLFVCVAGVRSNCHTKHIENYADVAYRIRLNDEMVNCVYP